MKNKIKKDLICILVSVVFMFFWIFVTVALTGGKEISDFTSTDNKIFFGFITVELLTVISMVIFLIRFCKNNRRNAPVPQPVSQTKAEKIVQRRGFYLYLAAYLSALIVTLLGIIVRKHLSPSSHIYITWMFAICCVTPIVLFGMNIFMTKLYSAKFKRMQTSELQHYIISHREFAEKTSAKKLSFLKKWRCITDIYAIALGVFAAGMAFSWSALDDSNSEVSVCIITGALLLISFSQLRFPIPKISFDEDETYISVNEYPELQTLVKQAANTLGFDGEIRIAILPDCNAGIAQIGKIYSIQLGAILLNILSKEELYNVLLHEFAHLKYDNDNTSAKEHKYNAWLTHGGTPTLVSGIANLTFSYFHTVYSHQYSLYMYSAAIIIESYADKAMLCYGNTEMAASALLKLKYYDLFSWEKEANNENNFYESEEPLKTVLTAEITNLNATIQNRSEQWNKYIDIELLSRSATHPTLKMRLNALNITEFKIKESVDSDSYKSDCRKALEYIEDLIHKNRISTYANERKKYYVLPKELVDKWETAGRPVIAEEYYDVITNLRILGRIDEAYELCERAIAELSDSAASFAHFIKGCILLHRYDESGIDHIYHAIETNPNYIEDGLEIIGTFCCMTGNQDELNIFREKAVNLAQNSKDKYIHLSSLSKKDNLSSEHLSEELMNGIMLYIDSVSNDTIKNIYLVRKNITKEYFTSVFIIQFDEGINENVQDDVMHRIFCHLDTYSWQFSLFNYTDVADVNIKEIENSCVFTKT